MELLAGRYELEERLGVGGSAVVWRARDTELDVERAVKVLHVAQGPEREGLRERLRTEAKAMARVSHAGIVSVHDVGQDGDRDFIVMDLVRGESLADRLERDGPLELEEAVRIGVKILQALGAAHAQGIVHRDVKPGNVLLDGSGEALVCDFGIALAEASEARHTQTGTALGSLPYMAPEQRMDARTVGPAADLYGVGCTLYNAVTCATPVDLYLAPGRSPRWSGVPEPLVAVLRRATAADPSDRYASAELMARALAKANAPPAAEPEATEPEPEATSSSRFRAGALWVNVTLVVLAVAISAVVVWQIDPTRVGEPDGGEPIEAPVPESAPVAGTWLGPLDGQQPGIRVELSGDNDALTGTVVLHLGASTRTTTVSGHWDASAEELVLREPENEPGMGTFVARADDVGVLRGQFASYDGKRVASFALVRGP